MTVVVVTGASAGVGRATVRAFARRGASIGLIAREPERLAATLREVEAAGARGVACPLDVADAGAVEAAAARIEDELGPIDVWVNCAMAAVLAPVAETRAADVRRVTEVTYLGYVHGTLAVLPRMRARDRGVIVMVGSALAYRAIPLQATYCAAKHAIRGFSDALRCELMAEGSAVRITSVHLPGVNTPQFGWVRTTLRRHPQPVPPIYEPEVAADAIVWASEHPRREFFVGGSTVATIVGNKLAPRVADRYLARTSIAAQQTDIPIEPGRPDYPDAPLPGDPGARGRFTEAATTRSPTWWATKRRARIAAAALAGAGVAGALSPPAMIGLIAVAALAASLAGAATIAAQRWGHGIGGLVSAFPLIVGPVLLLAAHRHGTKFAEQAAASTVLGVASVVAFALAYARSAPRCGWQASVLAAWAAAAVVAFAAGRLELGLAGAVATAAGAIAVAALAMPSPASRAPGQEGRRRGLVARMAVTAALIVALTLAADRFGAVAAGVLSALPILASVLAVFTHRGDGSDALIALMRGMLAGLVAFATFCAIVGLLVDRSGVAVAFTLATAAAVGVQALSAHARRYA